MVRLFLKSTHLVIEPGKSLGNTSYDVELDTVSTSIKTKLTSTTTKLEVTGTYGFFPSFGIASNITSAVWNILTSFGGRMDVVAGLGDVTISVNNPTFGYPYTVFVNNKTGYSERHNYYANESHTYTDFQTGVKYLVTRHEDSDNKEFTVWVKI